MMNQSFRKCGITLELDGSENADLNIEQLEDYEMPSAEEAYEFQLQRKSSCCEEKKEDTCSDLLLLYQFWGFDDKKINLFWF